jgi:hypothetical protein
MARRWRNRTYQDSIITVESRIGDIVAGRDAALERAHELAATTLSETFPRQQVHATWDSTRQRIASTPRRQLSPHTRGSGRWSATRSRRPSGRGSSLVQTVGNRTLV